MQIYSSCKKCKTFQKFCKWKPYELYENYVLIDLPRKLLSVFPVYHPPLQCSISWNFGLWHKQYAKILIFYGGNQQLIFANTCVWLPIYCRHWSTHVEICWFCGMSQFWLLCVYMCQKYWFLCHSCWYLSTYIDIC